MQEYQDGTFGDIKSLQNLFENLLSDPEEAEKTKAIHLGTEDELESLKEKDEDELARLKERIEELEAKNHPMAPRPDELIQLWSDERNKR